MTGRFSGVTALGLSLMASNGPFCRQVQEPKEVCGVARQKEGECASGSSAGEDQG